MVDFAEDRAICALNCANRAQIRQECVHVAYCVIELPPCYVLSAFVTEHEVILGKIDVDEITVVLELLKMIDGQVILLQYTQSDSMRISLHRSS